MRFSKMHGTGNDFVVIDARALERDWPAFARRACARHTGVGADGVILVLDSARADLKMRIFNSDGSEAETCGNGLRCFAKYAIEQGIVRGPAATVETLAGIGRVAAQMRDGRVESVTVGMGKPRLAPSDIPVTLRSSENKGTGPVIDYPLEVEGLLLKLTFVSMGNPHAVAFTDQAVLEFPLGRVGPAVERHPIFPARTNFEIARLIAPATIEARVWERGVGETLACGSGACAVAVAADLRGIAGKETDIALDGGMVHILWNGEGEVHLTGPAVEVFRGDLPE